MLVDDIKKRMFAAMKAGKTVEKEILRVAIGEITTAQARGGEFGDAETQQILRKLVKSNREALAATPDTTTEATLREEIEVLDSLLPQSLNVEQIVAALAPVAEALRAAPSAGPAMGQAMKHLKSIGAIVEAKDVTAALEHVRA